MGAGLDFDEKIQKATERLQLDKGKPLEQMIGSGLLQPFNNSNAGVI